MLKRILTSLDKLEKVPVDESVQHLFCKEFAFIADPFPEGLEQFSLDVWPFTAMTQLVLFQRFPAGQHQWEISGFPRRWLAKIPPRLLSKTLHFLFWEIGGMRPYFSTHLSPTIHRTPVLRDGEFLQAFYRMALALEKQPKIRAIFGSSWLYCPETYRVSPHLAFMDRPFLEAGCMVTNIGPAPKAGARMGKRTPSAHRELDRQIVVK